MWKFLKTEMQVILAMIEDASRTDAQISEVCGLKQGTVSSIRRRVLDAGAIHYANVPAFNRLGCELLAVLHGTTDPGVRPDIKSSHYMDFCNRTPQVFQGLIGGNSVVMIAALRDATDMESVLQAHSAFFTGTKRPSKAKLSSVVFPFRLSRIMPIPQFAPVVHNYFQLDVPPPKKIPLLSLEYDEAELSSTEKRTLSAMVASPYASDREIGSMIRLSRQAVTRMRNRFEEEKLITRICIPRLYRWGFEICAVSHPRFSSEVSWEKRIKNEPKEVSESAFYVLSKAYESVANFMASKYTQYSASLESSMAWYHQLKAFEEAPETILFTLDRSTELRTFDYSPAVNYLLFQDRAK